MTSSYTSLTTFFRAHRTTAIQISILPAPSASILTSPPHLGIPKPCLVSAFTTARTLFASTPDPTTQLDATLMLLLTASEHLTAVNARKRLLLASDHSAADELVLLESLLTSSLPRHNKSPLLWAHRRWVVSTFSLLHPRVVERELDVVRRSAGVHPMNYYAWNYARWVVGETVAPQTVDVHLRFCWRHAADVGVWAFLGYLLERVTDEELVERTIEEAIGFCDIAPGHESLWCIARTVIGCVMKPKARERLVAMLKEQAQKDAIGEEREREKMLEERALRWVQKFGIQEGTS